MRFLSSRLTAFIVPDQVGHLSGYGPARSVVAQYSRLAEVRYWGESVFAGVATPALTFVADRRHAGPAAISGVGGERKEVALQGAEPWRSSASSGLIDKLRQHCVSLGRLVADPGVHTGNCAGEIIFGAASAPPNAVPVLEGKQISRYHCEPPTKALSLDYEPGQGQYFTIRAEEKYAAARFVIRQTASHPIVGPRNHATYFRNSLLALYSPSDGTDVRVLVGLLNSRLVRFLYQESVQESRQKAFPQVKVRSLRDLPIHPVAPSDPRSTRQHDRMVELVDAMLALHDRLTAARAEHERTRVRRRIEATDREIDELVYELYRLTDEEIKIVDEATGFEA